MDGQNLQQLQEKWVPVLNHDSFEEIKDSHKRGVVAQLLENQERELRESAEFLGEAAPTNSGHAPAGMQRWQARPRSDLPDQTLHA